MHDFIPLHLRDKWESDRTRLLTFGANVFVRRQRCPLHRWPPNRQQLLKINSPIFPSGSTKAALFPAGVPKRIPDVTIGGARDRGYSILLQVMPVRSSAKSTTSSGQIFRAQVNQNNMTVCSTGHNVGPPAISASARIRALVTTSAAYCLDG